MSELTAACGYVVLLLTVSAAQTDWGVTYTSPEICVLRGSTVDISCTYTHPPIYNNHPVTVLETFWFVRDSNRIYVDVGTDPEYRGRVKNVCVDNRCTLTISDLRESDSAEYKFRLITNDIAGNFTGEPGVTLSFPDLHVQVRSLLDRSSYVEAELSCESSCSPPDPLTFAWNHNGRQAEGRRYRANFVTGSSVYCAVKGHDLRSNAMDVKQQMGFSVNYTTTEVCAFRGSTVDMNCTYTYPSTFSSNNVRVQEKFWFVKEVNPRKPYDLIRDSEYSRRVKYHLDNNYKHNLRITDVKDSDAAVYKFRFTTNQEKGKFIGYPGVTLTVADPQLQVQVRRSTPNTNSTWIELICHNSCRLPDHVSYVWYENEVELQGIKRYFHLRHISPGHRYRCGIMGRQQFPSPEVWAPAPPSVSLLPPDVILEGSSVTLTCSSDARPTATCSWSEDDTSMDTKYFQSISVKDSGLYNCQCHNDFGMNNASKVIDVQFPPKSPVMSVIGEVVEGSSVTLHCSSEATPGATCSWYKNQTSTLDPGNSYTFPSLSSIDSGNYLCKCQNKFGHNIATTTIDVQYAPRSPNVSVSLSGEITLGSSVNLSCDSDANPAASYTWYKEDKEPPIASGNIFTIVNIAAQHEGNYYCEVRNRIGRRNATVRLTVMKVSPELWKYAVTGTVAVVLVSVVLLSIFLLIRKRKTPEQSPGPGVRSNNNQQQLPIQSETELQDCHYSTITLSQRTDPIYSNVTSTGPSKAKAKEEEEEEEVQYTTVKFNRPAPGKSRDSDSDLNTLYSSVRKSR